MNYILISFLEYKTTLFEVIAYVYENGIYFIPKNHKSLSLWHTIQLDDTWSIYFIDLNTHEWVLQFRLQENNSMDIHSIRLHRNREAEITNMSTFVHTHVPDMINTHVQIDLPQYGEKN